MSTTVFFAEVGYPVLYFCLVDEVLYLSLLVLIESWPCVFVDLCSYYVSEQISLVDPADGLFSGESSAVTIQKQLR